MYAVQSHGYHPGESNWQDFRQHFRIQPHITQYTDMGNDKSSIDTRHWLLDPGSLTQRLIKSSDGQFKVHVLQQHWGKPRLSEAKLLGMNDREYAIIREVVLLCKDKPWVFARSVIPASSITGRLRRLRKFSNSSLGEMLFRDRTMRRSPFQLALIKGNSSQIPKQFHESTTLWGRRCRFELIKQPIMVSEIFLSAFRP